MKPIEAAFLQRIGYSGDVKDISKVISRDFNLGEYRSYHVIPVGYEDFNFCLKTDQGKYFVKIFAESRTLEDCIRNVEITEKAISEGVRSPKLYRSSQGYLHVAKIKGVTLRTCVLDFVEGKDLFTLGYNLILTEIKEIAKQAALINKIKIIPKPIYDSWAIPNFPQEYHDKSGILSEKDRKMIRPLLVKFADLDIRSLPHCFVHGDILRTNILKDRNGLWIVDFSCGNYYPRIQELAVLACDVLFNPESREKSERNLQVALSEYQRIVPLTHREIESLPTYIELGHAMHVLRTNYERKVNHNRSTENGYFLNQGRIGLRQMLE